MSRAPEGMSSPPPEMFQEWTYRVEERLGLTGQVIPGDQARARARFEADRAIEQLHGTECSNGWIVNPSNTP